LSSARGHRVALALARRERVDVALRSGGHCFAGRSSTTGVVIDLSGIEEVSVSDGTVAIGAGARLGDVYDALATHERTIAAGCGPTVGIAGVTLGGGLGILGRQHGLTADQLVAARAVLADGRIVDWQRAPPPGSVLGAAGSGRRPVRGRHAAGAPDAPGP
jgi:FAD/FMN-containing dehydrogenase